MRRGVKAIIVIFDYFLNFLCTFFKIYTYSVVCSGFFRTFASEMKQTTSHMTNPVKMLAAALCCLVCALPLHAKKVHGEKKMGAYLFTFFNDATHSLFMAVSFDGYTFTAVNDGQPIISGDSISEQHGIRDPHICRSPKDGAFYMAMTDLHIYGREHGLRTTQWERDEKYGWGNNRALVLLRSEDLRHWTHTVVRIDKLFPEKFGDLGCAWAPETIYDPAEGRLMVYFTIREKPGAPLRVYYSYADDQFTTLTTEPRLLFDFPDEKVEVLDADICPMPDGRWFMTYVAQENPAGIKYMISNSINHFDDYHTAQIDTEPRGCEAPNTWKRLGEQRWVVMYDVYSLNPHNFGFVETTDFKTFTPLGHFNEGRMRLIIPAHDGKPASAMASPKHGCVIPITRKEARRLLKKW